MPYLAEQNYSVRVMPVSVQPKQNSCLQQWHAASYKVLREETLHQHDYAHSTARFDKQQMLTQRTIRAIPELESVTTEVAIAKSCSQAPVLAAWLQVRLTSEVEKQCTLLVAKEYCTQQLSFQIPHKHLGLLLLRSGGCHGKADRECKRSPCMWQPGLDCEDAHCKCLQLSEEIRICCGASSCSYYLTLHQ